MVVGAFPAAKLGVLALKQISKPIATFLKSRAKNSQFFRQYICMPPAQFYNWMEVKTKMWAMNLGKPVNVPQLNETMAIELGANLLGETIIFTIGAGVLVYEYIRQSKKEEIKEETGIQEKIQLSNTINELHFQIERQDAMLREMTRIVADLESRTWLPKKPKIFDDSNSVKEISSKIDLNKPGNVPSDSVQQQTDGNILNPYPNHGVVFRSLNYIQNELFYRTEKPIEERKEGIVTQSLIYLENYQ